MSLASSPGGSRRSTILSFLAIILIWGSTWLVIRGQLGSVAPQWSVTYRFVIAALAMFLVAIYLRLPLALARSNWPLVALLGLFQFCVNFNFVYLAERHVTSGLVGTMFALLLIPNSLFAWALLGQRPSWRFLAASAVAVAGIGLLFLQEYRANAGGNSTIAIGIALTLVGLLGASIASVLQARPSLRDIPMPVLLGWSMLCGVAIDTSIALLVAGAPTFEWSFNYVGGLLYLSLAASAFAFSLYFPIVRRVGPARAAYASAIVPIIAMGLSTLFEDYRWTRLAVAGAALTITGMWLALATRISELPAPPAD